MKKKEQPSFDIIRIVRECRIIRTPLLFICHKIVKNQRISKLLALLESLFIRASICEADRQIFVHLMGATRNFVEKVKIAISENCRLIRTPPPPLFSLTYTD